MDRLYTSISTSNLLLAQNITSVGTLASNRVRLPDEVKHAKNRDEFESSMYWEQEEGNLALCIYTTNSKSIPPTRPLIGIIGDDGKQKSVIINFYDFTKGGRNILNQKIPKYSCKSVTQRWKMVNFFFLLDTIRCNALTMYEIKHGKRLGKISGFDISWEIVMSHGKTIH